MSNGGTFQLPRCPAWPEQSVPAVILKSRPKRNVIFSEMTASKQIRVANAPCSWGVLEFDLPGKPTGYATVLDEIRDTGYEGTEFGDWGFMPTEPSALRRELDARQLG